MIVSHIPNYSKFTAPVKNDWTKIQLFVKRRNERSILEHDFRLLGPRRKGDGGQFVEGQSTRAPVDQEAFKDYRREISGRQGRRTLSEPILWIIHLGYAWLVAGFALKALAAFGGSRSPWPLGLVCAMAGLPWVANGAGPNEGGTGV